MNKIKGITLLLLLLTFSHAYAQKDTLRVYTQNVLYYGNGCQGPNGEYHRYFETIVKFANPDIISLVKLASIKETPDDKYGTAPYGFADSILQYAVNKAFPGRYAYCPFKNEAKTNNNALLIYDQRKLGFVSIVTSYVNVTDFNTYKLYYKDPNLSQTHDTTFLYLTLNHDKSGKENEEVRNIQIKGEMDGIKKHFKQLPNFIDLGDFNVRNSDEEFYKMLTKTDDKGFLLYDPPFFPDKKLSYPADWDHNPSFASYLTTSTRESDTYPNSCGSGGGAKNWYDHIFLSQWIVENTNHIRYIPNSYRTIGNDGKRFEIAINNSNTNPNTSAPKDVIEALFRFSNKYPVMVDLEVTTNSAGKRPADPEIRNVADAVKEEMRFNNPGNGQFEFYFPESMMGQQITVEYWDKSGAKVYSKDFDVKKPKKELPFKVEPGDYTIRVKGVHNLISEIKTTKEK